MANTGDRGHEAGRTNPPMGQGRSEESSAAGMMGAVKDRVKDLASGVAQKAEDAWDSTREHVSDWTSSAGRGVETAWDNVNGFFRRYPVPMFLAGIGLGFLLAKALSSSSTNMTRRMSDYSSR